MPKEIKKKNNNGSRDHAEESRERPLQVENKWNKIT